MSVPAPVTTATRWSVMIPQIVRCTSAPYFAVVCGSSGDDAPHLEIDERVPVEAELEQHLVALFVERGCAHRRRVRVAEADRRRGETERLAVRGLVVAHVPVRDHLRVV